MDTPTYNQLGMKISAAGIVAIGLSHLVGVSLDSGMITKFMNDGLVFIGDIATIYGIIHQAVAHRKLAVTTGTIK